MSSHYLLFESSLPFPSLQVTIDQIAIPCIEIRECTIPSSRRNQKNGLKLILCLFFSFVAQTLSLTCGCVHYTHNAIKHHMQYIDDILLVYCVCKSIPSKFGDQITKKKTMDPSKILPKSIKSKEKME